MEIERKQLVMPLPSVTVIRRKVENVFELGCRKVEYAAARRRAFSPHLTVRTEETTGTLTATQRPNKHVIFDRRIGLHLRIGP